MSHKIVLSSGTWGSWKCIIESDNGKGDFSTTTIGNKGGIYLDRIELLELAIRKLGIELEYVIDGKVMK